MKYTYSILLLIFSISLFSQTNKCGLPDYIPKQGMSHTYKDTCGKGYYDFKSPKWYRQYQISQSVAPQFSFVNGGVTIDQTEAFWFNTNNQIYYKAKYTPSTSSWSWESIPFIDVNNLVFITGEQTITGKKTFADSIKAEKGIISGGLIDTKGLNTEGSTDKAAATINGVQAERDTVVSTNFTLSGLYKTVGFICTTGQKDCVFPNPATTINWIYVIRKDEDSANDLVCKLSTGTEFYRIKSKMTLVFKNVNGTWKRQLM